MFLAEIAAAGDEGVTRCEKLRAQRKSKSGVKLSLCGSVELRLRYDGVRPTSTFSLATHCLIHI